MVRISPQIGAVWRGRAAAVDEPAITLVFRSTLSDREALLALAQAAGAATAELTARAVLPGRCSFAIVPEGVALRIDEEPEDLEGLLAAIAAALEAASIEGSLDLYEPAPPIEIRDAVDLLECRLRVRGARRHRRGPNWEWHADTGALAAALDHSMRWCTANSAGGVFTLVTDLIRSSPLPSEDVGRYLHEAAAATAEVGIATLVWAAQDRFRAVAVEASRGRVSLVEGGATIEDDGWRRALEGLRAVLAAAASYAVYGYVKRGASLSAALSGLSLVQDWVSASRHLVGSGRDAFEDEYAPDAFGMQLLGAGYAGRVPVGRDWRHTPVGSGATVLEHLDPAAWFGGVRATEPRKEPLPELVARARGDFGAILFEASVAGTG